MDLETLREAVEATGRELADAHKAADGSQLLLIRDGEKEREFTRDDMDAIGRTIAAQKAYEEACDAYDAARGFPAASPLTGPSRPPGAH